MPNTSTGNNTADNHNDNKNPKWWNPTWTLVMISVFVIAVIALFIATRYYVGHPNDTPAFVSGIIGLLTLYAIIVQVAINRHQWKAMRDQWRVMDKQAATMDKQTEIALRQLESADRPWLDINITVASPLTHPHGAPFLNFKIIPMNIGQSVAVNVVSLSNLIATRIYPGPEIATQQAKVAKWIGKYHEYKY